MEKKHDVGEDFLGKMVHVKIDRPFGTKYEHYDNYYEVNYGYVPGTVSGDGEELDAYVLGEHTKLEEFDGRVVAVIKRTKDDDDKLVVMADGRNYTDDQIEALLEFQERFFEHIILRP